MKKILLLIATVLISGIVSAHENKPDANANNPVVANNYAVSFEKAYGLYPDIPHGLLEGVAFTNSRFHHITHEANEKESCTGIPKAYGVMGLTLDGKNYFTNNLKYVAQLSGYTEQEIISDPEKNILAYAKAFSQLHTAEKSADKVTSAANTVIALSELPHQTIAQNFALNTQLYGVLSFMTDVKNQLIYHFQNPNFNIETYFGENYKILSSHSITMSNTSIKDDKGNTYKTYDPNVVQSPDYGPALWVAACNYSNRNSSISAVTIHDMEGSYAGTINWFANCASGVSAHYCVRSSDGQITQMVYESDKAWHVGNDNSYTIGIEHEGYYNQTGWYTTNMYTESAKLVCAICNYYGIPKTSCWNVQGCSGSSSNCGISSAYQIKGHQNFYNQSHIDPGPNWDWPQYYNLVNSCGTSSGTGSQPVSTLDVSDCNSLEGWAYDADVPNNMIDIHIYVDGNYYTMMQTTNYRPDVNSAFGISGNHGFIWTVPNALKNGQVHTIDIYAINDNGPNPLVSSTQIGACFVSPGTLTVVQSTCPNIGVTLNWQNTGPNNFWLDIGTDPNFGVNNFYNQNVSNLTSVVCPGNFCLYDGTGICNNNYLQFQPNTLYYWRIWNGNIVTAGSSFTTPSCIYVDNANCTGVLDDSGGQPNAYSSNEDYVVTLSPPGATNVTLNFTSFDLEDQFDFMYIYDGNSTTAPLIGTYTGLVSPGTVTSTGGSISVRFSSDPLVNNAGWTATWNCTASSTGVDQIKNADLVIFPNPSADVFVLSSVAPTLAEVLVYDMLGNEVLRNEKSLFIKKTLDLSANATGIYFVKVKGENFLQTYKVIKQ